MASEVEFFDVRSEPFEVYGLLEPKAGPVFRRLPDTFGTSLNKKVNQHYLSTAGGRVRFSACTGVVAVRVTLPEVRFTTICPQQMSAGLICMSTARATAGLPLLQAGQTCRRIQRCNAPDCRPRYLQSFPVIQPGKQPLCRT